MKRSLIAAGLVLAASPALAASKANDLDLTGPFVFLAIISLVIYFFPSIIAVGRGHHNKLAIFLLNLFLGWSILGWVGSLVWAATQVRRPVEDDDYLRIRRHDF